MRKIIYPNKYLVFKDHAEIEITSEKFGIFSIKISIRDINKCKKFHWGVGAYRYKSDGKIFYYATNNKAGLLHRYLMGDPKDIQIDHKNRNTLDCTRENLRKTNHSQQGMNGNKPKNNTSGHLGVTWVKRFKKWMAYITKDQVKKNLGYYDNIKDAIDARKQGEIEYFGEYNPSK